MDNSLELGPFLLLSEPSRLHDIRVSAIDHTYIPNSQNTSAAPKIANSIAKHRPSIHLNRLRLRLDFMRSKEPAPGMVF